ncbi:hypothetical protein [Frankia gtarii]|uniref:hypothetical protein n=1 Tax=Frankia gtarii TaxID=2950102 RepID=UPI0021BFF74D|nr:hypothetical protein [Frankia gtarii]
MRSTTDDRIQPRRERRNVLGCAQVDPTLPADNLRLVEFAARMLADLPRKDQRTAETITSGDAGRG